MKYKNPIMRSVYETMLALAADQNSELYYKGAQRRGAMHRCAFWDGFNGRTLSGQNRTSHVVPGTLSAACFYAGRAFARKSKNWRIEK